MTRTLLVTALAIGLGACGATQTVLNGVDSGIAKADAFIAKDIAPPVERADNWLVARLGPPLDRATHWFFCNKDAKSSCAGK